MKTCSDNIGIAPNDTFQIKSINSNADEVKVSDCKISPQDKSIELLLRSSLFIRPPHNVRRNGNKLVLTVEELVKIDSPGRKPEVAWGSYFYNSYIRFHNFCFSLPVCEFVVSELRTDTRDMSLKIILRYT